MVQRFIFGDWGSTALRLGLYEGGGPPVETAEGAGIKFAADPEQAFFAAAGDWFRRFGPMPVVLAGMVGSNRGWKEAAYAPCPAGAADLARLACRFEARGIALSILPGLSCRNIFGFEDVMRGEEMQIFGWLAGSGRERGRHLACLPGTHAKWALVEDGRVVHFFTGLQGELFDLLLKHSLLGVPGAREAAVTPEMPAFRRGLQLVAGDASLAAQHAIFAARSLLVTGSLAEGEVAPFLSGILIGADVRDALASLAHHGEDYRSLSFIGSAGLIGLYAEAAACLAVEATAVPAEPVMAAAAGLLLPELFDAEGKRT